MTKDLYKLDSFVLSADDINASIAAGVSGRAFSEAVFGPRNGMRQAIARGWMAVEDAFSSALTTILRK